VKNGIFICPLQDNMKVAQNDIIQLPMNRMAEDVAEFVSSINVSTEKKPTHPCDNCDGNEGINWCDKCGYHYCESCTESVHAPKALRSHAIIPTVEKIQSFCMDHPGEKLTLWCKKCETLLCRDCLYSQHKYHTHVSLDEAASAAKGKFQETVQEIDEIRRNSKASLEMTKCVINQQRKVISQEKEYIEQTFADLQRILEERKRTIIQELDDNESQTMNILNRQRAIINQHLNLTIVQELCIKKMLDSNNPLQILKFKSILYRNYNDFVEQFNKIDDGYIIKTHILKKYGIDIDRILDMIAQLGHIKSTPYIIKADGATIKTLSLDISRVGINTGPTTQESNIARGYKFLLKKSLELRSIQIHSDHLGQITGFIVNDAGIVVQKGTINSTNATKKWLRIPLEYEIQNNYSVLVVTPSDHGSYTYKIGDNQPRVINQYCTVESQYAQSVTQINVGSKLTIENNISSIDMKLDIEE